MGTKRFGVGTLYVVGVAEGSGQGREAVGKVGLLSCVRVCRVRKKGVTC